MRFAVSQGEYSKSRRAECLRSGKERERWVQRRLRIQLEIRCRRRRREASFLCLRNPVHHSIGLHKVSDTLEQSADDPAIAFGPGERTFFFRFARGKVVDSRPGGSVGERAVIVAAAVVHVPVQEMGISVPCVRSQSANEMRSRSPCSRRSPTSSGTVNLPVARKAWIRSSRRRNCSRSAA